MSKTQKTRPIITLRDGALKACIWENEGEGGRFLTTTFAKTYTKDGDPADTKAFSQSDLLPLSELSRKAYDMINHHRSIKRDHAEAAPASAE